MHHISVNTPVLLLNSTYEPLNVINIKRAFRLLTASKAELLEAGEGYIHLITSKKPAPSVVRMRYHIKRPIYRVKFTKQAILSRDRFRCAYCGTRTKELTIDHVIPKTKGGQTKWENVVSCCKSCNAQKGDKTPAEVGLKLLFKPKEPRFLPHLRMVTAVYKKSWDKYLFAQHDTPYLLRGELPNV